MINTEGVSDDLNIEHVDETEPVPSTATDTVVESSVPSRTYDFSRVTRLLLSSNQSHLTNTSPLPLESSIQSAVNHCSNVARESLRTGRGVICVPIKEDGCIDGVGVRIHTNGIIIRGKFDENANNTTNATLSTMDNEGGSIMLKGHIVNGTLKGEGEIMIPGEGRYAGFIENGVPHGVGVWSREDGSWYEGEWFQGMRHGQGSEHYTNSIFYTGQWMNDLYNGKGKLSRPDWSYQGQWVEGKRMGSGELTELRTVRQTFEMEYTEGEVEVRRTALDHVEINRLKDEVERLTQTLALSQSQSGHRRVGNQNESASICKVCFNGPVSRVLRPCNHACLCKDCETKIREEVPRANNWGSQRRNIYSITSVRIKCPVCRVSCSRSDGIILS